MNGTVPDSIASPDAFTQPEAHPMRMGTVLSVKDSANNELWCPEPESNRHGLAAGGF
jgi:hypothetical protein